MSFGVATVVTNVGYGVTAKRLSGGGAPTQTEPKNLAIGVGATGAARTAGVGDTALSSEAESRSGTNSGTVQTTSVANDTYQVIQTITATGSRAVDEAGLFDTATSNSGSMFASATFNVVNLNSGDSIQLTWNTQVS
jgi:hypothetical protein